MHDTPQIFVDDQVRLPSPLAPDAIAAPSIAFTGEDGDFRRLVTRGALLELVTAGFYRFWLATDIRRHLWSHTIIGGDALEYLGTGRELLFGFFFALAILAPVYLLYFLIGIEAEQYKAFASLPLFLFFAAFGQFALYRARRYRLHRTSWRGLRFGMSGSGLAYAARAFGWGLLVLVTLGSALPWAEAALERYKMRHTFYGDLTGDFVGEAGRFLKNAWWIWATALLFPAIAAVAASKGADAAGALSLVGIPILLFLYPTLYAAFKAAQWRWWLEGLRIGEIRVTSNLSTTSLLANYLQFGFVCVLVLVAAGLVAGLVTSLLSAAGFVIPRAGSGALPPLPVLAAWIILYLTTFLALGVLSRIYLTQRIWKLVLASLTAFDLETAENVAARASTANALGEGFADSLDVVGF